MISLEKIYSTRFDLDTAYYEGFENCTPKELEVVEKICTGITVKEISRDLDISERTLRTHIRNICTKLLLDEVNKSGTTKLCIVLMYFKYKGIL